MDINISNSADILIFDFVGALDTNTATKTEMEINKHLDKTTKMIINLKATTFVSSAGLRIFLATAKKLKMIGGSLRICHANDVVSEILEISGFTQILVVKPTLEEALSGF